MIKYYDRKSKIYKTEKVAGEKMIKWTYSSPVGMRLLEAVVKKRACSSFYGWYLDQPISRRKIHPFVSKFDLDLSIAEKNLKEFSSFNDFFYRKLKPTARTVATNENIVVSLGDGKLLAYENIDLDKLVQVKGFTYSLKELIKNPAVAAKYQGGTCLILRLCPTDYHRFHFIDSGTCEPSHRIKGVYYSVNPMALQRVEKLFCENKREWSLFHSDHFGDLLYVEVGATFVGSIVQTFTPCQKVVRGAEKGYFKFGGSTVLLFFEKDRIKIDSDIIEQTNLGYETSVLFGEKIGVRT